MAKFKNLKGIVHNLAQSFISVTNIHFLEDLESTVYGNPKNVHIDFIKETIYPESMQPKLNKIIERYKNWFLSEISKSNINLDDINEVLINISVKFIKVGDSIEREYTCNSIIETKNKKRFTAEVKGVYL